LIGDVSLELKLRPRDKLPIFPVRYGPLTSHVSEDTDNFISKRFRRRQLHR
jgi:hypothetical protein